MINNIRVFRVQVNDGSAELHLKGQAQLKDSITVCVSPMANSGSAETFKWCVNQNQEDLSLEIYAISATDPGNINAQYDGIVDVWLAVNDAKIETIQAGGQFGIKDIILN